MLTMPLSDRNLVKWFVLRDLTRSNARMRGYLELRERGLEVFTPMKWEVSVRAGKRIRKEVPVISDLLFVHASKDLLDAQIAAIPTLQYRYMRGHTMQDPMTVRDSDMERFINAVTESTGVRYFMPDEISPEMYGREITIVGGPFDGYSGRLLSLRGSKKKRLIVEIPGFIAAAVEVLPEYIAYK